MEFGDRTRFAITVELNENHGGLWMYGRFCYWIAGESIGNYDAVTSLRDILFRMRYLHSDRGQRTCPELMKLSTEKMFSVISAALRNDDDEIYNYIPEEFPFARLDVGIHVDVMDNYDIYLVDNKYASKILYFNFERKELKHFLLDVDEFDRVSLDAYDYLDRIYDAAEESEGEVS
ncbi:Imm42 family immunity protein [Rhizobium leguminosarum]|uniref:Immunity protein 23 family protein n=1 Tax=Rhizobium leguminosarum TaxID=384 RepID=A0A2Z4YU24_RHILE|nr:Imm42 family immunity protein [Rhizobium leguminosarum]AXA44914.1 Immunity protein 23 family protein [Rhizobium leguminosarum]